MSRPQMPRNSQRPAQMPARPQRTQLSEQVRSQRSAPNLANQAQVRNETRQFTQQLRNVQGNVPRKMTPPQNFGSMFQNQTRAGINASNLVGNNVRQRFPNSNNWFNDRFFNSHPSYDFFRNPGANWWSVSAWGTLATWFPWGWQDPYYYYYPGYTETGLPNSDLYVQLTDQAPLPTQNVNEGIVNNNESAWMPLGVFTTGVSEDDAAYSNFFIQLAVNKSGEIAGTFYNAVTDEAQVLAGSVDSNTQQAIWKASDNPNFPSMITGLYNLTQDVTKVQVYFEDEPQAWMLVRVKK